ncbi:MarR family transcriptional regulator [Albimonas sp. CAU 1670]|uniref:MarR family winged helix-turn-helix transcriptional regulator n=1 Tax=Albimonas sp. CAU 1670 TaxID=3032599 RepID=UPI0023D9BA60|nr:MarR family transcriptional regulator [Albimonas sp. CAU 1670]MDF2234700.1 MarR family transcriptional regulator [Albimonas sp. CAU 1670]
MTAATTATTGEEPADAAGAYRLTSQAGHLLRRANQRHLAIFAARMPELTPRQFAALAKLHEEGPASQNQLGRATSMDAATIKGVIDRLAKRALVRTEPSLEDRRRLIVSLTEEGAALFAQVAPVALEITQETLAPLDPEERRVLVALLDRIS